MNIIIYKCH